MPDRRDILATRKLLSWNFSYINVELTTPFERLAVVNRYTEFYVPVQNSNISFDSKNNVAATV